MNFDYKVWVLDFNAQLGVFMAPLLIETSLRRQGAKVEYVQTWQLELETSYVQKRKNETWQCVKRCRAWKAVVVVVVVQVQEVVTFKGGVKLTPNKNMQQYEN